MFLPWGNICRYLYSVFCVVWIYLAPQMLIVQMYAFCIKGLCRQCITEADACVVCPLCWSLKATCLHSHPVYAHSCDRAKLSSLRSHSSVTPVSITPQHLLWPKCVHVELELLYQQKFLFSLQKLHCLTHIHICMEMWRDSRFVCVGEGKRTKQTDCLG